MRKLMLAIISVTGESTTVTDRGYCADRVRPSLKIKVKILFKLDIA